MKTITRILLVLITAVTLSACQSKYNVDVDITPEERQGATQMIDESKLEISNYDGEEGSIPFRPIIRLADAYETLGEYGKAIKTYKKWLDSGQQTRAMIHNLGRLYEKVGETELAVARYQTLINEYFENGYLYDITWAYIKAGERKNAEKFFNLWQLKFQKTDTQTQQAIKKLREAEKNNS